MVRKTSRSRILPGVPVEADVLLGDLNQLLINVHTDYLGGVVNFGDAE